MNVFIYSTDEVVYVFNKESLRDAQEYAVRFTHLTDEDCRRLAATGKPDETGLVSLRSAEVGHIRNPANWTAVDAAAPGLSIAVPRVVVRPRPWWKFWGN